MDAGAISAISGPIVALAGIGFAGWSARAQRRDQRRVAFETRQFTARAEVYVEALEYLYGLARGMAAASPLSVVLDDSEALRQRRLDSDLTPEELRERTRSNLERETLLRARVAAFGSSAVADKFNEVLIVEDEFSDSFGYPDSDDELDRLVDTARQRIRELELLIRAELGPLLDEYNFPKRPASLAQVAPRSSASLPAEP